MTLELLEKMGLKWEDLNTAEKQYLEDLERSYQVKELTLADITKFVNGSIDGIVNELVAYKEPESMVKWLFRRKRRIHLEARLKNLLMLREFISAPAKAREVLQKMMKNREKKADK